MLTALTWREDGDHMLASQGLIPTLLEEGPVRIMPVCSELLKILTFFKTVQAPKTISVTSSAPIGNAT